MLPRLARLLVGSMQLSHAVGAFFCSSSFLRFFSFSSACRRASVSTAAMRRAAMVPPRMVASPRPGDPSAVGRCRPVAPPSRR
jgi:hypothetical protein